MIKFHLKSIDGSIHNSDIGYVSNNVVHINLYHMDEDINEICKTLHHEFLHLEIGKIKKEVTKHKWLYDFFEEKIIRDITGEEFDPEEYYELVQLEE